MLVFEKKIVIVIYELVNFYVFFNFEVGFVIKYVYLGMDRMKLDSVWLWKFILKG